MSDDESAAVGPSPAKSIAVSVASTMASRKSTKESAVQAKVAAMSRAELEDGMFKLLSKLQAKEKQIKEMTTPAAVASSSSSKADQEKQAHHQEELKRMEETIKGLKEQLKQQQVAFDNEKKNISSAPPPPPASGSLESWRERAIEAESKLTTSDGQVMTLIQASKESAMAHGEQVDELITELKQARAALEESQKVGQEMREKELMYQQQLTSLKEALRELGAEREAAFVALGEYKERGMDQADELNRQLKSLESDLDAKNKEVLSLSQQLEASQEKVRRLEDDLKDKREASPDPFLPAPPATPPATILQQPQGDLISLEPLFNLITSMEQRESETTTQAVTLAASQMQQALDSIRADLVSKTKEIERLTSQLEQANDSKTDVREAAKAEDADDLSLMLETKDKEINKLSSELADTKKKLLAAAKKGVEEIKKKDHELKDLEVKLKDLSAKHEPLLTETTRLRLESQELVAIKAEKVQMAATAAAKQKELEQAQSLMQEYKQLLAQKDSGANHALAKAEAEVKRVQVEMEKALSKVESKLHEKELDCEGLVQQLSKAEKEASDLRRALEGKSSGVVAELQAAKTEAEASKVELLAVKKELEGEKARAAKALDEAKKRLNKAQKLQHVAELELAESRGKAVAEKEGGKLEAALANQALETCKRDMERLDAELKDYKSRAQALLKQKDAEIKEARETLALTMIPIDKFVELESKLAATEKSLAESIAAHDEHEENHLHEVEKERSMHSSVVEKLEGRVKYFETLCTDAQKDLEEWRNKSQALEARLNHHQSLDRDASIAAVKEAEEAKKALAEARSELESVRTELKGHLSSSEELMEAKDTEMLQLVRRHTILHEEVTSLKEQLATITSSQAMAATTSQLPNRAIRGTLQESVPAAKQSEPGAITSSVNESSSAPEEGWEDNEGWGAGGGSHVTRPQPSVTAPVPPPSLPLGASSANLLEHLVTNPGLHPAATDDLDPAEGSTRELVSSSDVFGGDEGSFWQQGGGRSTAQEAEMALSLIKRVKELLEDTSKAAILLPPPAAPVARTSSSSSIDPGLSAAPSLMRTISLISHPDAANKSGLSSEYDVATKLAMQLQAILQRNRQIEADLLEMEKELSLREEMETALKESLREAERASVRLSRNTIDVEYLKNTVLKIYRTGDAEQLLPVFAMILAFSPDEVKSCQMGLQALKDSAVPLPAAAAAVDATLNGATSMLSFLWGGSSTSSTTT